MGSAARSAAARRAAGSLRLPAAARTVIARMIRFRACMSVPHMSVSTIMKNACAILHESNQMTSA